MGNLLIKAIAWDWGRVLGVFDHTYMWEALAKYTNKSPSDIAVLLGDDMKLHETGAINPTEFFLRARGNAGLGDINFGEFCEVWGATIRCDNPRMPNLLRRINPSIRQCVLSNTDPIHWMKIGQLPLMREFFPTTSENMLVRSYDDNVKARKPSVRIYREACRRLHIRSEDTAHMLYIDDIANYCDVAENMGIRALQYNCTVDSIEKVEDALSKLGALT